MEFYYCFDVGGTYIKSGIISQDFEVLYKEKFDTKKLLQTQTLASAIYEIAKQIEVSSGLKLDKAKGIGVGLPGLIDDKTGTIKYIKNLGISDYSFKEELQSYINLPIKMANDAECAVIAEYKLGAGVGYKNFVMITLGTGIGGGIIINGTPLRSNLPYSSELGHMIDSKGIHYESLASTRALENQIKEAMEENPKSKLWEKYNLENVTASALFEYKDTDAVAKNVFETYILNLGKGIVNIYNVLMPELIIIGGGISKQGDALIKPLADFANERIFARGIGYTVNIKQAKLTNDAGILGTRCLFE